MQYLGAISKTTKWSWFVSKAKFSSHSNPSLCPNHWCQGSGRWPVLWKPTTLPRTNTRKKKNVLFIIGDWKAKVGSQEIPGIIGKFDLGVQNEARQRITEFCQENMMVIANNNTRDDSTHGSDRLHSLKPKMEKLYIVSKSKTWSWLWLRSWTPYCKLQA